MSLSVDNLRRPRWLAMKPRRNDSQGDVGDFGDVHWDSSCSLSRPARKLLRVPW
jgi:hypothetical protein